MSDLSSIRLAALPIIKSLGKARLTVSMFAFSFPFIISGGKTVFVTIAGREHKKGFYQLDVFYTDNGKNVPVSMNEPIDTND